MESHLSPLKDYVSIARNYQDGVIAGSIPACKWVRLACERNRRDMCRQGNAEFPYHFDESAAQIICQFGELLPFVSGRGFMEQIGLDDRERPIYKKFELQPWQIFILTTVFGWKTARDLRRFRVALLFVPRKNGKSNLCAIIALYMLTEEREPGAQVYSAATTRDQARMIAEVVWEMARRAPELEYYGVKVGSKTRHEVTVPSMASKFIPLSADANSLDGLNISCGLIDEFQNHKTDAVWNVVDTATSARKQPLIVGIGTAGATFGGVAHSKLLYLERVLDGTVTDETLFGLNYTMDEGDDYKLPSTALKANPNYGVSVEPDDIARKVNVASQSHDALDDLLVKHFNVWLRRESAWMGARTWQACEHAQLALHPFRERYEAAMLMWAGYPCWIGVDLGEVRDYSVCALLFQLSPDSYALIPRIYIPADAIAQSPVTQLSGWVRDGAAIVTPGSEADYQRIEDDLVAWIQSLNVTEVDFDRRSARLMIQKIKQRLEPTRGRDAVDQLVVDVPQSIETMDPAMKMTERLVSGGRLLHDGNPLMAWMISNVVVERNHKDEIYPRKAEGKDSPNKIDGPVSLFTAMSRAMKGEPRAYVPMVFVV